MHTPNQHPSSILTSLRHTNPHRACRFDEALTVAELQAAKLNQLLAAQHPSFQLTGITEQHIAALPHIRIAYEPLPVSGMTHWNGHDWIICLNTVDPEVRQRFTLLHEFKHIIDHHHTHHLYTGTPNARSRTGATPREQAERAADYFAGCALIPRTALKHAWGNGIQHPAALAEHFNVSQTAIHVRLNQTGLNREHDPQPDTPHPRCRRPVHTPWGQTKRWRVASTK